MDRVGPLARLRFVEMDPANASSAIAALTLFPSGRSRERGRSPSPPLIKVSAGGSVPRDFAERAAYSRPASRTCLRDRAAGAVYGLRRPASPARPRTNSIAVPGSGTLATVIGVLGVLS